MLEEPAALVACHKGLEEQVGCGAEARLVYVVRTALTSFRSVRISSETLKPLMIQKMVQPERRAIVC